MLDIAHIPAPPNTTQMIADDLLCAQRQAKAADAAYDAALGHMLRRPAPPSDAAQPARGVRRIRPAGLQRLRQRRAPGALAHGAVPRRLL